VKTKTVPQMRKLWIFFIFLFFIMGCSDQKKLVKINELTKGRSHEFSYSYDGNQILLEGLLVIDGEGYPTQIYYNREKSILIRSETKECLEFQSASKVLFGFVPPFIVDIESETSDKGSLTGEEVSAVSVITDENGNPANYEVSRKRGIQTEKSIVDFGEIILFDKVDFSNNGLDCKKEEEFIFNV
jgi:hypothetical protein